MDAEQHSKLLLEIKADFDTIRKQGCLIGAKLVHTSSNAEQDGISAPPRDDRSGFVAAGIAGHRPFRQRFDADGNPKFIDEPSRDVEGNPIANSAGEAFDIQMPAHRTVMFYGDRAHYDRVLATAKRAGSLLAGLPDDQITEPLREWEFSNTESAWWAYVFEAAWARVHPHLRVDKQLWINAEHSTDYFPYDSEALKNIARQEVPILGTQIPAQWLKRLPDAFTSRIDDLASACYDAASYACDRVEVVEASGSAKSPETADDQLTFRKRFAIALSFPGEHRALVGEVAGHLAAMFREERVLYDKFHEVEFARSDLDMYLPGLYRDQSDLIVVFGCEEYDAKEWPGLEWRYIRDYMKDATTDSANVMMLTVDGKFPKGWLRIDGYLNIADWSARRVADALMRRWCANR